MIQGLRALTIQNNDISLTVLYKLFIVYRFPNLSTINGENVSEEDKSKAKSMFMSFDKIL